MALYCLNFGIILRHVEKRSFSIIVIYISHAPQQSIGWIFHLKWKFNLKKPTNMLVKIDAIILALVVQIVILLSQY